MTPSTISLTNGVSVRMLSSHSVEAVRMDIVIPAGLGEQDRLLQALFTNRLLREGTVHYTAPALAERLDWLGAWVELTVSVHHSFVTLYTLRRFVPETFRLVQEMLFNPTFSEEQLEVVRANNRSQYIVNRQRGDVVARRLLGSAVYGTEHPCGQFAEENDYNTISRDDIIRFHHDHYIPSTFTIFLSGDVDDDILHLVDDLFGRVENGGRRIANPHLSTKNVIPSADTTKTATGEVIEHHLPTAVQASVRMGGLMMDVGSEDYYLMRIVTAALGGYFGSRLMRSVREELGYTYNINADLFTNTRQVFFVVSSEAAADKGRFVVDEVIRQCEKLCTEPLSDNELTLVRNYMTGELYRNYESIYSLVDAYIFTHTLSLPDNHIARTAEVVRTATPDALLQVARRWLRPELLHTIIVAP